MNNPWHRMSMRQKDWTVALSVALAFAAAALALSGCVSVPTGPAVTAPDGTTDQPTALVLGLPTAVVGVLAAIFTAAAPAPTILGALGSFAAAHWPSLSAVASLAFPRVRENAVGIPDALLNAITNGNGAGRLANVKDAALHVAALTPLAHTPDQPVAVTPPGPAPGVAV